MPLPEVDVTKLPWEIKEKLFQLQLELSEGDITQKGFEKKKHALLKPYIPKQPSTSLFGVHQQISPSTRAQRRAQRRATKDEHRFHSEIRAEAVHQALAEITARERNQGGQSGGQTPASSGTHHTHAPIMPVRRAASQHASKVRRARASESSSDGDESSTTGGDSSLGRPSPRTPQANGHQSLAPESPAPAAPDSPFVRGYTGPQSGNGTPVSGSPIQPRSVQQLSPVANSRGPPPDVITQNVVPASSRRRSSGRQAGVRSSSRSKKKGSPLAVVTRDFERPASELVASVTKHLGGLCSPSTRSEHNSVLYENTVISPQTQPGLRLHGNSEPIISGSMEDYANAIMKPAKVSSKIQQLLNTLQRPKRRPLQEFYNDDDAELEALAKAVDPAAPKPEGAVIAPARGETLRMAPQWPASLEAAIQRYGLACHKTNAITVLDQHVKPVASLTYGKLHSRAYKVAYSLLNKLQTRGAGNDSLGTACLKAGDRVALVYPNNDPLSFVVAFHGCLLAGVVPVPIEVPTSRRDAGVQQLGFLLGSCGVTVALTSEACLKGLPKGPTAGEVLQLKGWPRLHWFVTEHLPKTPKDWLPPIHVGDDSIAYIEYTTSGDGSVKGVCVSRQAMLTHTRALSQAAEYNECETMICVLDFKREVGLWHAVITSVYNGMHVVYVPYSLMKVNPASWMLMVTKYRATVALVKSRDLHWGLLASREHKDVNFESLRLLLVADGANPWSLTSCDQFIQVFQQHGLKPHVLCPCAGSSESLTVSIRKPGRSGFGANGRGVLSMPALSHGVVRVDNDNSLTSLTLQDAGHVIPGATAVVVRLAGEPYLCKADEVGELCVRAHSTGTAYYGLDGLSAHTFKVEPLTSDGRPLGVVHYVRTGLVGFLGPGGLVFICATRASLLHVSSRAHSSDDLIATVLAVEPMRFIYRGRIAVFAIEVLRDQRICIVAEQKPDVAEEESFKWMSRVLQAIDSIHQVGVYCLALVAPNRLPKTPLGGIHVAETRQRFLDGNLHPTNLLMCPHTCVTNLPRPREPQNDVGPAAMFVGNIVQGARIASAEGRSLGPADEDKMTFLHEVLKWRADQSPDHVLFTLINVRGTEMTQLTCAALQRRAERIAAQLKAAQLSPGDHVALIYPPGVDIIAAFYGALNAGLVPVCVRPPHPSSLATTLPTVRMIVDVSRAVAILSTGPVIKLLRSKEASTRVDVKVWPTLLDTDEGGRTRKLTEYYRPASGDSVAYLDFSVSTTGMLAGIKMTYASCSTLCKSLKLACELYPSRAVCLCLDPYSGLGFVLWCLSSVYAGHHSILIPPSEVELNPTLWLSSVSQYRVRDTFCSYGVQELCVRELAGSPVEQLRDRGVSLSCLRTCTVVCEERPRHSLHQAFAKLFAPLGLNARAVASTFGCRVNLAVCMQGASDPDPSTVFADLRSLRNDRVALVERGAPHSVPLMESGKVLPGVKIVIANPDTRGQCADSHLGEIWVSSGHNSAGYFTVHGGGTTMSSSGDASAKLHADHFQARLTTGDTMTRFARTGYLGFLKQTQNVGADGALHDALYVVGALDETLLLRGMRFHPVDVETTVMRAHRHICECAVFSWTNLLVVCVELDVVAVAAEVASLGSGSSSEDATCLDVVALTTSAVLDEHHLIVGVCVVLDQGTVPINSRGEKQRMHLRDAFLHDQLDPIYVAYNM